jgi:hypothetical protein
MPQHALLPFTLLLTGSLALAQVPASPPPLPVDGEVAALHNSFVRLTKEKRLKVVIIGNSVSYGGNFGGAERVNYVTHLLAWLKKRFPEAQIDISPSIIFAIGPEVQLFRMEDKVFSKAPDLVVVEFGAANGAWGARGQAITDRATEGYLRRLRFLLPRADILMNLGIFKSMLEDYQKGVVPPTVLVQQTLARHYACAFADSERAIADRVLAGEPFETFMKDFIHPSAKGYEVHGEVISAELERQYAHFLATPEKARTLRDHAFPKACVHPDPWLFPRLESALLAEELRGFTVGEKGRVKYIAATDAGASGTFTAARGKIVGVFFSSPDMRGNLEVRLDGAGEWTRLTQKNEPRFTEEDDPGAYLQRVFFGGHGLPLYSKRVDFRVSANPEVPGNTAVQIIGFFVIEREPGLDFSRP